MRSPLGGVLARPVSAAIDQVVKTRYGPAADSVAALRRERPAASPSQLADQIIGRYRRELGGMGAASGGVAAVPGIGTGLMIAGSVSETGWSLVRLGQMVLELGLAYGHDARAVPERRAWVLAVLALALGAAEGLEGPAGAVVRRGGVTALKAMPAARVARLNRVVAGRLLLRLGSSQAAIRLGNIVPLRNRGGDRGHRERRAGQSGRCAREGVLRRGRPERGVRGLNLHRTVQPSQEKSLSMRRQPPRILRLCRVMHARA